MQYKEGDLVTINTVSEAKFKVVMASETSSNLMLNKCGTNELWTAHFDDVTKIEESNDN